MASLRKHNRRLSMFASPSRNAYDNQATARFTIDASTPTTPIVAGSGAAPYHYGPSAMANIRKGRRGILHELVAAAHNEAGACHVAVSG